jgi:hypothetical protein
MTFTINTDLATISAVNIAITGTLPSTEWATGSFIVNIVCFATI